MNAVLLDTHVFVWLTRIPSQVPAVVHKAFEGVDAVFVSAVSLWEIVIRETGREPMVGTDDALGWFNEAVAASGFTVLPIGLSHLAGVQRLPVLHRDPFDRLLIAQARVEGLTIVSKDHQLSRYDVSVIWDEAE